MPKLKDTPLLERPRENFRNRKGKSITNFYSNFLKQEILLEILLKLKIFHYEKR